MGKQKNEGRSRTLAPYITVTALAKRWGMPRQSVIDLIEQGRLEGLKIRGVYRISARSITRFEKEKRENEGA